MLRNFLENTAKMGRLNILQKLRILKNYFKILQKLVKNCTKTIHLTTNFFFLNYLEMFTKPS